MSEELLPPPPFDTENLPPNDFDFQCFIMFSDGRIALSDGGTVCADRGQIIGWMHLHEAADFMNTRPDSKPYKWQSPLLAQREMYEHIYDQESFGAGFFAARERKEG